MYPASMKRCYFLKCGNFVKIGSSINIEDRLQDLRTGNPYKLELLGDIKNSVKDIDNVEADLHYGLKSNGFHHQGEWFHLSEDLKDYIKVLLHSRVRYFSYRGGVMLNETKRKIKIKLHRYFQ